MSSDLVAVLVPEIQENQLVLPESTDGLTLAHYLPALQQYREVNAGLVFDYRDKKGNAAARSHVAKLRKIKSPLGEIHKRLKAEYLAITQQMDADKRDAMAIVEEMIEHHDKELRIVAAEEAAEAQRKKIEVEISEVWDLAHDMNAVFDQQQEISRRNAEQDRIAEQQAAEQRRIDKEKREKEIADKAADDARKLAEADAAKKLKEAEERAAREKADIETRAKADEDRKRREEEQARADLDNVKRVHWAIIPALVALGMTENQAKTLILAIRGGEIPALLIDYQWQGVA